MTEEYVKPAEAAKIKGISRAGISLGIKRGKIRTREIDGKVLVCLADIKSKPSERLTDELREIPNCTVVKIPNPGAKNREELLRQLVDCLQCNLSIDEKIKAMGAARSTLNVKSFDIEQWRQKRLERGEL